MKQIHQTLKKLSFMNPIRQSHIQHVRTVSTPVLQVRRPSSATMTIMVLKGDKRGTIVLLVRKA